MVLLQYGKKLHYLGIVRKQHALITNKNVHFIGKSSNRNVYFVDL